MTTEAIDTESGQDAEQAPPRTHIKYEGDGTRFVQFRMSIDSGCREELTVLTRLHQILPAAFARPIGPVTDETGEYAGYEMEYIDGQTLDEVDVTRADFRQLRKILEIIHSNGLAHGDLNFYNILKQPDGNLKLIDPVGYGIEDSQAIEILQQHDLKRLRRYEQAYSKFRRFRQALARAAEAIMPPK